ncbi:hypothetical protein GCM10010919_17080 [Alishewanella longhuensis]|uniref:Capsule biosynthesis GfcC-like C-terminal domain-containing protein n=1 Tax=Alishewanella longhuensis TaxID=1091037 RepID=A0ABQ3L093_9ALTE|nr:capsule biosynthesis GfcC family protein [Alishewanella longhuensis]GHG67986.1 hypothetical protein GCM10010919_17080 [Alishewanella longhuensis]
MKPLITSLLTALVLVSGSALANTRVTLNGQVLEYQTPPRLATLLAELPASADYYWPAAALYRADASLEQDRVEVLNGLARLMQSRNTVLSRTASVLHTEIKQWRLAKRVNINIDFDQARRARFANPRLTEGEFWLHVPKRAHAVHVFGAVLNPGMKPLMADADAYRRQGMAASVADNSIVILGRLNGSTEQRGIAYWNNQHAAVYPGEWVFVPFGRSVLPAAHRQLNDKIAVLATNRVPL